MVDKKDSKGVNKSDEIRKLAAAMKERGEKPRPVVIVATLKKQGVVVSSPQVSMVLKRMGFRPRKRGGGARVFRQRRGDIVHASLGDGFRHDPGIWPLGQAVSRGVSCGEAGLVL